MKKILVTGVAGFIGSHICQKLLEHGFNIIGIDSLDDYYSPSLKEFNLSFLKSYKGFGFLEEDILNKDKIFALLKTEKIGFLIHCAAQAGARASFKQPLAYTVTNVLGTQTLLEAIRLYRPEIKSILLSSSSVYGIQEKVPFSEEMMLNPQSPYGVSKYIMELMAKQYYDFYKLPLVILRPFSVYGPRGRLDMAPFLIIKSAERDEIFVKYGTNKDNKRDWTYIDDLVDGVLKIIHLFDFSSFEIFNFGNSKPIGIDDFISLGRRMVGQYLKKDLKIVEKPRGKEELPITFADIGKAKRVLGYNPKTDLEKGLEKFFKFYAKHRSIYKKSF